MTTRHFQCCGPRFDGVLQRWLDELLEAWAREVRDPGPSGISLLGRIIELGADGATIRTTASTVVAEWDDRTYAVECAVLKLPWHYQGAIILRYVLRPNAVDEARARHLNVKLHTYRYWMRRGHAILADNLHRYAPPAARMARRA